MSPVPITDLDAELGLVIKEPMPTKKVKMLGRQWTIICDLNSFSMAQIAGGEPGGISKFLTGLIAEEERDDFIDAMTNARGLDGEKLATLMTRLIEVASERPTESPSASRATARRRTSTQS